MNTIGLIGGAGPSAGSLLFDKVIEIAQKKYGCAKDCDYPYMLLLNFPFSDMLEKNAQDACITRELEACFQVFEKHSTDIVAIGCNTLHAFLPPLPAHFQFVHMIEETKKALANTSQAIPLVLCTSTSARKQLHRQHFPCEYASPKLQTILDRMIADIVSGADVEAISDELSSLLPSRLIVLGCTEFSYLNERAPLKAPYLFDPNAVVAEKIAGLHFATDTVSL